MTRRRFLSTAAILAALALPGCAAPPPVVQTVYVPTPVQRDDYTSNVPGSRVSRVQLYRNGGSATLMVKVAIAGVCCFPFILDTGADDMSVPPEMFKAMVKGGHVGDADIIGESNYQTANGTVKGWRFRMPEIQVGEVSAKNVVGSITPGAPALLGQSFLRKFRSWEIDNAAGVLILRY